MSTDNVNDKDKTKKDIDWTLLIEHS